MGVNNESFVPSHFTMQEGNYLIQKNANKNTNIAPNTNPKISIENSQ